MGSKSLNSGHHMCGWFSSIYSFHCKCCSISKTKPFLHSSVLTSLLGTCVNWISLSLLEKIYRFLIHLWSIDLHRIFSSHREDKNNVNAGLEELFAIKGHIQTMEWSISSPFISKTWMHSLWPLWLIGATSWQDAPDVWKGTSVCLWTLCMLSLLSRCNAYT